MNLEEIAMLCANMSLTEKDGPVQRLHTDLRTVGIQRVALCLVGKVITNKMVNREAFLGLIGRIWQVEEGLEVEVVRHNIFTFHFHSIGDQRRVLEGGPWTFDGTLIVLAEPSEKGAIEDLRFDCSEFWVQIHCVPLVCMTKEIGRFLRGMVGEVMEVDVRKSGECSGKFLKVRVRIDVNIPLRRYLRVDVIGDGEETAMVLRYEHLPNHCFRCGCIGHSTQDCPNPTLLMEAGGREDRPFGAKLRASGPEKLGGQKGRRGNNFNWNSSVRYAHEKTVERKSGDATFTGIGLREHGVFGYKPVEEELNVQQGKTLNVVTNEDSGSGGDLCGPEQASLKGKGKIEAGLCEPTVEDKAHSGIVCTDGSLDPILVGSNVGIIVAELGHLNKENPVHQVRDLRIQNGKIKGVAGNV
ncbi:hypothetical protein Dsin_022332 [Dipteronia sinensis]|uniref:CCHC-type domain-containing protein n=1 Tax=Dipteronia sinensis TaxID=43782 RepID=A0AAE0A265_9ROSI|nr:hypothetical protein Dsin_022332 [Dipteronia sinensis]